MVDSKQMYSENQLLLVLTLTPFYHLHIKLVRFTPWTEAAVRRYSSTLLKTDSNAGVFL